MTAPEFWAGAASGASRKMLAKAQRMMEGVGPNRIMVNYQTKMSGRDARWKQYDLFLDPGAYSMFAPSPVGQGHEDYPQSAESYIQDVGAIQPELYAWRDYVCEKDVQKLHKVTPTVQMERTTEAHIKCADLHEDLGISADPVAVVQGWEPAHYRNHAQQLVDHGLVTDRVGVGTMCGRADVEKCEEIIRAVRDVLPDVELHAFGLDRKCYGSDYILGEISSTDSLAYCYKYKRPAGWTRWEFVFKMYMDHRADWDDAVGGAEYQSGETADHGQTELGEIA